MEWRSFGVAVAIVTEWVVWTVAGAGVGYWAWIRYGTTILLPVFTTGLGFALGMVRVFRGALKEWKAAEKK